MFSDLFCNMSMSSHCGIACCQNAAVENTWTSRRKAEMYEEMAMLVGTLGLH